MEIITFFILLFGGFFAAFYASMVGGMGFVTLPLLIFFGLPLPIAIGTNRLVSLMMDTAASVKFYLHGQLFLKISLLIGTVVCIGSFFGAQLIIFFSQQELRYFTVAVLVLAFIFNIYSQKITTQIYVLNSKKHIILGIIALLLLGLYGGIIGIAFGTLIVLVPALFGYNFVQAAGMARVAGVMMSLTSTYVFVTQHIIDYSYALPMVIGVILGSWFGISFGIKREGKYIKFILSLVLLASIIQILFFL